MKMLSFSKIPITLKITTSLFNKNSFIPPDLLLITSLVTIVFCPLVYAQKIINHQRSLVDKKICVIGDSGSGYKQQYSVAHALKKAACDEIIHLGDIIYPKGIKDTEDIEFQEKFYLPYKPLIEDSPQTKFHLILGNHDYDGNPNAWKDLAKKYDFLTHPSSYFIENYQDICMFFMDGTVFYRLKLLKAWRQYQFFKNFFKDNRERIKSCKLSFLFNHYPYMSSGKHGDASWPMKWLYKELFVGNIDIMISGHDHHLSHEGEVLGTQLFISGAAGKLRPVNPERAKFTISTPGFMVITFFKTHNSLSAIVKIINSENKILYSTEIKGKGIRSKYH